MQLSIRAKLGLVAVFWVSLIGLPVIVVNWIGHAEHGQINQAQSEAEMSQQREDLVSQDQVEHKNAAKREMELNEMTYLSGVLAAEMPASFQPEALRAQAIAARSYYYYRSHQEGKLLSDQAQSAQKYIPLEAMRGEWGAHYPEYVAKLKQAVAATQNQYLLYEGRPALAVFFASSNGSTESSETVWGRAMPYLVPVRSPWEHQIGRAKIVEQTYSWRELAHLLGVSANQLRNELAIQRRTAGNRVDLVRIAPGQNMSGTRFRDRLGLSSTDFYFVKNDTQCFIISSGSGHGVGMSQWGAEALARKGWDAEAILSHYYPGTKVEKVPLQITYKIATERKR